MNLSIHPDVVGHQVEHMRAWAAHWASEIGVVGALDIARHLRAAADIADQVRTGREPVLSIAEDLPAGSQESELRDG